MAIDEKLLYQRGPSTIDAAVIEFKDTYKERVPYATIPTLNGNCYQWDPAFIENVLMAMSTDSMIQFTEDELETWQYFVNFQNYHSTSALDLDCNGTAVGCTTPNELNESYVVCGNGHPMDGLEGRPKTLCQPPGYEIEGEQIWKSLDTILMSLYYCIEPDDCNRDTGILNIAPCTLANL